MVLLWTELRKLECFSCLQLQHYGQILTMSLSLRIKMTLPCISAPIFTITAASTLQIHRFSGCPNNWFS